MLRDKIKIVFSINDNSVKEWLLREVSLDLTKTLEICRAAESSKIKLNEMTSANDATVCVVNAAKPRRPPKSSECGYCGTKHERLKCPAFGATCSHCGKQNHFKMCRSRAKNNTSATARQLPAMLHSNSADNYGLRCR